MGVHYRITFDAQNGTANTTALTEGAGQTLLNLPIPTKAGYTFDGWFDAKTGGNVVTVETQFGENTTIYAQWTEVVTPVPVTGVSLSKTTMNLTVGADETLVATVAPQLMQIIRQLLGHHQIQVWQQLVRMVK